VQCNTLLRIAVRACVRGLCCNLSNVLCTLRIADDRDVKLEAASTHSLAGQAQDCLTKGSTIAFTPRPATHLKLALLATAPSPLSLRSQIELLSGTMPGRLQQPISAHFAHPAWLIHQYGDRSTLESGVTVPTINDPRG
jgi:hypothetical protein